MKTTNPQFFAFLILVTCVQAEEKSANPDPYKTVPRFGIPDGFYTDHDLSPNIYLEVYEVRDTEAKLSHSEKLSAALLVIAANHANYEKRHRSYGVSMGNPLLVLLQRNFPGLSDVKPSHDVNPGELPIRDLGDFFRAWLKNDLSEELQEMRVRKALGVEVEETQDAEQDGSDRPATAPESKPEGIEKPKPESEGRSQ